MSIMQLAKSYNNTTRSKHFGGKRINPTHYYVKHYLAVQELQTALQTANFEDRSAINAALTKAQNKMQYFYKKSEFSIRTAHTIINTVNRQLAEEERKINSECFV